MKQPVPVSGSAGVQIGGHLYSMEEPERMHAWPSTHGECHYITLPDTFEIAIVIGMEYQNRQPGGHLPEWVCTNGGGNRSLSAAAGGITERSLQPGFLPVWLRIILPKRIRRSTRGRGPFLVLGQFIPRRRT